MTQAKRHAQGASSSRGYLFVLGLLVVLCLGVIGRQEYKIYRVEEEAVKVQERVTRLQTEQQALQKEQQQLYDIRYIEKLAREDHHMAGQDEVPLFIGREQGKTDQTAEKPAEKS